MCCACCAVLPGVPLPGAVLCVCLCPCVCYVLVLLLVPQPLPLLLLEPLPLLTVLLLSRPRSHHEHRGLGGAADQVDECVLLVLVLVLVLVVLVLLALLLRALLRLTALLLSAVPLGHPIENHARRRLRRPAGRRLPPGRRGAGWPRVLLGGVLEHGGRAGGSRPDDCVGHDLLRARRQHGETLLHVLALLLLPLPLPLLLTILQIQAWCSKTCMAKCPTAPLRDPPHYGGQGQLYAGMIAPILRIKPAGIIWHQAR